MNLVVFLFYLVQRKKDDYASAENRIRSEMLAAGYLEALRSEMMEQQKRKHEFSSKNQRYSAPAGSRQDRRGKVP